MSDLFEIVKVFEAEQYWIVFLQIQISELEHIHARFDKQNEGWQLISVVRNKHKSDSVSWFE